MTQRTLVRILAERTGYPERMVQHVVDELNDVLRVALLSGATIYFENLFAVSTKARTFAPRKAGKAMAKVRKLTLSIRPMRVFRKEMDQSWTSSESSRTTTT